MAHYPPLQEKNPDPAPRKRAALRWIVFCAALLMTGYGGFRLVEYGMNLAAVRRTTQELREIAAETEQPEEAASPASSTPGASAVSAQPEETSSLAAVPLEARTAPPAATEVPPSGMAEEIRQPAEKLPAVEYPGGYAMVEKIRKLRKKEENIIGWITMDDLDEPVAFRDNSFFLTHDVTGRRNSNGAIFMDEGTRLLTRPYTILLYGHNMKSGAMFGNLKKYRSFSYCYRHRFFQFDTLYEEGQYVIFVCDVFRLTPGTAKFIDLAALQSLDRQTRREAIRKLTAGVQNNMMVDVNEEDQILLLITCVGDDNERLIVAARRLREGETADKMGVLY